MRRPPAPPLAAAAAGLLVGGVAGLGGGPRAAVSAGIGVIVVVGFFAAGALPLLVVRGDGGERRTGVGTAILLLTYTLRLAVAVAVLRLLGGSDAVDPRVTGIAVIAGALAWVVAQAVSVLRSDRGATTSQGAAGDARWSAR